MDLPDPPEPKLSAWRVAIAVVVSAAVIAGLVSGAGAGVQYIEDQTTTKRVTWFAPYVDTTLTPTYAFQSAQENPARGVALGFVVADPTDPCAPSWGGYHSVAAAGTAIDLDRRVAQLRGRGGEAIISFGGQRNRELAVACRDEDALLDAYETVRARYRADTLDFDVEGVALADVAANARRARVVKRLQDRGASDGGRPAVWLTLPVTPAGLQPDAIAVVRTMLAAGVDLAGVNVMALDFGDPEVSDMFAAVRSAAAATHEQLAAVFGQADIHLNSRSLWGKLGVTVMIGQNDVAGERFSPGHARKLARFARERGVARVSMWSLNRDSQCGVTFAAVGAHSNLCSGVKQQPLQFSRIFAGLRGSARAGAGAVTASDPDPYATTATTDVPARSPYPIWEPTQAYPSDYKVVWRRAVYQAKWYTQGRTPDAPESENPWRLIGPVLATDRAPEIPRRKPGTHAAWSPDRVHRRGDRVLYRGLPYQAKWYTRGDPPGTPLPDGVPQPWRALYTIPGEPGPL